jgi:glycosyltransferase involved in cell wall biosynthesis
MKILRVINSMKPETGGPCQGIRNTIPQMDHLGAVTEVLCLDDASYVYPSTDTFKIYAIGQSKGPWAYHNDLMPWLLKHLSDYDIVMIHGLWQYHSYAVIKAIKRLKKQNSAVPTVYVMPHGMLDPYFQKAEGRKLKAIRNSIFWHLIESKVVNQADGILFTCQEELELASQTFSNYHPKNVHNVGYGVLPPPSASTEIHESLYNAFPFLKDQSFILFLSRVHEKKGVDLLINAYQTVYKHSTENPPILLIAGPGMDSDYGKQLSDMVTKSNFLNSNVHFVGMLQGDVKWGAFYNSEVFILPSHQENFGIAVAEALACRKPVLISDKVNIWREIEQGHAGIVAKDDLDGVIHLLDKWKQSEERKTMSDSAYHTYQSHFTVEQAAQNLYAVFKTTMKHA